MFAQFSYDHQACRFRGFSVSVLRIFSFFSVRLRTFYENLGSLSLFFFFFEGGSCFRQRKFWPTKSLFIITTQPIVVLLGFASYFGFYSLSNIIKIKQRQDLFNKPTSEGKPFFPTKKLWNCLPFWADLKFPSFTSVVFQKFTIIHPFNNVDEGFCNSSFFVKKIFSRKNKKFQPFLLIRRL